MSIRTSLFLSTICAAMAAISPFTAPARAATPLPQRLQEIDRGPTDPSRVITVTVHLAKPDSVGFKKLLAELYDRKSPMFHKWLTNAQLRAFAPPAAQRDAVAKTLQANGLKILSTDTFGFSIRARGTVGDVARAFGTSLHDFERNGQIFRRNVGEAKLAGGADAYVHTVAGLESHTVHPMISRATNLQTGKPWAGIPAAKLLKSRGFAAYVTDLSLAPTQTFDFTTSGGLPTATYSGIVYDGGTQLPDFAPNTLEQVYGLAQVYKKGLNGAGQTIVLLEGYGYPTLQSDANTYYKISGLPLLTTSNFSIVYPQGVPADPNAGIDTGWNTEIALDLDSSHSIAPGANIVVVASNGQDGEDFQAAMQSIIDNDIGTAVSDSWEEDTDLFAGPAEQQSYEDILEVAAAKGISFQFSTGDGGDGGLGTPVGAPGVPSVSPHATAVGGTAILNNPTGKGFTPVAWGDDFSEVNVFGPVVPPFAFFNFGGGGGESVYWPKPVWQASLPGTGRQTPDVSALADPYTGIPVLLTSGGVKTLFPGYGGTSLASPIFTAFWVLAQEAVGGPLGQASPTLAALKTGLTDVAPLTNANDITGSITTSSGTSSYTTADIFAGAIGGNTEFVAGVYNLDGGDITYGIGFGLDSSLTATVGWDNATGYGTPNGLPFINAVKAYVSP